MKLRLVAIGAGLIGLAAAAVGVAVVAGREAYSPIVVLEGEPVSRPAPRPGLPNVVLVVGCTIRRDQVSIHGGPPGTTPTLTRIASEGAVFSDTIAAAPWTKMAGTALLTGHHAVSIGMVEAKAGRNHKRLAPEVTTLAEHLRGAGYATVGATANPNLNAVFGFDQGFDRYVQLERLWRDGMVKVEADDLLPRVEAAIDGLSDDGRPLFLQVVLVDAHAPFEATPSEVAELAEPGLPEVVGEYRVALRRFDRAVAAVDELLARRGLTDENTLFVVVSDHGEGLGWPEHHGKAHGRFLAPSAVGALWAVRGPGVGRGVRVDGVSSQVDLVPTLLGQLGLDGYDGPGFDHSALLASGGRGARTRAFTDTWFIDASRAAIYTDTTACQRDFAEIDFTAARTFREGCFDRLADPLHERPRPDRELEGELAEWRRERVGEMLGAAGVDAAPSDELGQQLEALGYLDE